MRYPFPLSRDRTISIETLLLIIAIIIIIYLYVLLSEEIRRWIGENYIKEMHFYISPDRFIRVRFTHKSNRIDTSQINSGKYIFIAVNFPLFDMHEIKLSLS